MCGLNLMTRVRPSICVYFGCSFHAFLSGFINLNKFSVYLRLLLVWTPENRIEHRCDFGYSHHTSSTSLVYASVLYTFTTADVGVQESRKNVHALFGQ